MMRLSIVIVSFNTKEILKKCLGSLKLGCSGLRNDWEVVVVDNNSIDGSVEFLKKWSSSGTTNRFVVLNGRNVGFAKGVNQGIRKARGRYFLLLNSDIVCQKGSIAKLVEFAEGKNDLGLVGGKLLDPDGSSQASVFHLPTVFRAVSEFWLGKKGAFQKYLPRGKRLLAVEAVVGAVMLIPRETIREVGLLDERFFMYFEDFDYCRRIKKAGLKVYYYPEAEFFHYHGQSGKRALEKVFQYLVESSKIYHGNSRHFLINFVIWTGQKWQKMRRN